MVRWKISLLFFCWVVLEVGGAARAAPVQPSRPLHSSSRDFRKLTKRYARAAAKPLQHFEPLRDGQKAFARRLRLIDNAQQSLVGTLYGIDLDRYGFTFLDRLIVAAERGVQVVVSVDRVAQTFLSRRVGKKKRREFGRKVARLEKAGGFVAWNGGLQALFKRPGSGQHYKAFVADGKRALLEGRNVGHEYYERWTDFGAYFEGPIVADIAAEAWRLLKRAQPYRSHGLRSRKALRERYDGVLAAAEDQADGGWDLSGEKLAPMKTDGKGQSKRRDVAFFAWDPVGDERTFFPRGDNRVTDALTSLVNKARREIVISSNFVHPASRLRNALIAAARRNVKVKLITTGEQAAEISVLPYLVASAHYGELVAAGCEIYETKRMDHAKLYSFDGAIAGYGSYNASKMSDSFLADGLILSTHADVIKAVGLAQAETIKERSTLFDPLLVNDGLMRQAAKWLFRRLIP
jgi:phosphatidylserine/phosphatidylglycerophosphate/cardiolipin synthase-like enzyme